jgi:hypothetical protein
LKSLLTIPVVLAAVFLGTCVRGAEPPAGVNLMRGYWRCHYTLAPARTDLKALAAEQKRTGFCKRVDLSKPYFGFPFYFLYQYSGHAETSPLTLLVQSPPPPRGWMRPEFDGSSWPRRRLPLLMQKAPRQAAPVKLACFRARFVVEDPARLKALALRLAYRGGVVVYVNGVEVARGHLPDGEIGPDMPGETYPLEAHVLPPAKIGKLTREDHKPFGEVVGPFPGPTVHVHNLANRGDIPKERVPDVHCRHSGTGWIGYYLITREEWNTLKARRDRVLGPVRIPARLLKKGTNVLGIEIHRSDYHPAMHPQYYRNARGRSRLQGYRRWFATWQTAYLADARLLPDPAGTVGLERPPAEPRVWTVDVHQRLYSADFPPANGPPPPVRLVGVRYGTFSGQVAFSAPAPCHNFTASVSDLVGPRGARIPASAVAIRYGDGKPLTQLRLMGHCRWGSRWRGRHEPSLGDLAVARYIPEARQDADARRRAKETLQFFDHLTADPPARVPARSCQSVWINVRVPNDAAPGGYKGTLSVRAGDRTLRAPVRLRVIDWTLPDPAAFETVMALEQSPYGVAKAYKLEPWSAEHWARLEASMRRLGQVGGDLLIVPVLAGSEFGNGSDSMIRWTRKNDGTATCDFSVFERYLDLARKHFTPRCVCFGISHATDNNLFVKPRVVLKNGSLLDVPPPGTDAARAFWRPFLEGVRARLAERGLTDAWHWGYHWDCTDSRRSKGYFAGTVKMMAELAPGVGWARGCHRPRGEGPFTFVSSIYALPRPVEYNRRTHEVRVASQKGWKNPELHLCLPRIMNTVLALKGTSLPYVYRLVTERAIAAGGRGVARLGADYWADAYQDGWSGGGQVGMSTVALFWPGPKGAEGSARFEALREGLQETEARIFLERKLEDSAFAKSEAGRTAQAMLDGRIRETLFVPQYRSVRQISECYGGWQERSWDLYAAAARAAGGRVPSAQDRRAFFEHEP